MKKGCQKHISALGKDSRIHLVVLNFIHWETFEILGLITAYAMSGFKINEIVNSKI